MIVSSTATSIRLDRLDKRFGETRALIDVSLEIERGAFVTCLLYTSDAADE